MTEKKTKKEKSEKHLQELEDLLKSDIRDSGYSSSRKFYLFRLGIRFVIYLLLTLIVYLVGLVDEFKLVVGAVVFFILIELVRFQFFDRPGGDQKVSGK